MQAIILSSLASVRDREPYLDSFPGIFCWGRVCLLPAEVNLRTRLGLTATKLVAVLISAPTYRLWSELFAHKKQLIHELKYPPFSTRHHNIVFVFKSRRVMIACGRQTHFYT